MGKFWGDYGYGKSGVLENIKRQYLSNARYRPVLVYLCTRNCSSAAIGGWAEEVRAVRICQQTRHRRCNDRHRGCECARPFRHQEPQIPDLQDFGYQGRRSRRGDGMVSMCDCEYVHMLCFTFTYYHSSPFSSGIAWSDSGKAVWLNIYFRGVQPFRPGGQVYKFHTSWGPDRDRGGREPQPTSGSGGVS